MLKGNGAGARLALGNLSAPRLLLLLVAGAVCATHPSRGGQPHLGYFLAGAAAGVMLGAAGAASARRGSGMRVALAASLLICEPFAWLLAGPVIGGALYDSWGPWCAEIAVGLLVALWAALRRRTFRQLRRRAA